MTDIAPPEKESIDMNVVSGEVRWLNEEAKTVYEMWRSMIEIELEAARAKIEGNGSATSIASHPPDIGRIQRETHNAVRPMIHEAAKLYAAYTMPSLIIRTA